MADEKKLAKAYLAMSKAYALLAEAYSATDEDDDDEDVAPAKSSKTVASAGRKGTSKASDDDDDDSEDSPKSSKSGKSSKSEDDEPVKPVSGSKAQKQALAELKDLDIDGASRRQLAPLAEAFGIPAKGVVTEELQKALKKVLKDGGVAASDDDSEDEDEKPKSKKSNKSEDDEEDEAPAKSAKKKPAKDEDDDEDDDDEVEYPDRKEMKRQMRLWAKAHRTEIIDNIGEEYFDSEDDAKNPAERLHQTLADLDVLKEQWKDNVAPLIADGSWKKIEKKYAEAD